MDKITITHELHAEIINILAYLCVNIQNEFDISPDTLNHLINKSDFIGYSQFLYQQCYIEMLNNIQNFKNNFDMTSDDITPEEYEKCGHLITSHQNTYVSYCNYHKYLHPHPNVQLTNSRTGLEIADHKFVTKTHNQIIKERYNTTIHLLYQSFINKVYHMINQIFNHMIHTSCQQTIVRVSDDLPAMISQMNNNKNIFKSKVIYEHISQSNSDQAPDKFYYIKVFNLSN